MTYEEAGQFARSAGVKENQLTAGEFNYLVEIVGAELVTIDGDKVVIRVDGKVNDIYIPAAGGGVKTLSGEMPRQYGYSKVSERRDVSYFGCYVQSGSLGGYEENTKWSGRHLWSCDEIKNLLVECRIINHYLDDCDCIECKSSRVYGMREFCRLANTSPGIIPLHPVRVIPDDYDGVEIEDYQSEETLLSVEGSGWDIVTSYERMALVSQSLAAHYGVHGTTPNLYTFQHSKNDERHLVKFSFPFHTSRASSWIESISSAFENERVAHLELFSIGQWPMAIRKKHLILNYEDWVRMSVQTKLELAGIVMKANSY